MVVIVDYGMGNLRSVSKALETLGASVRVSSSPAEVASAKKLVLPGVGAMPAAMRELNARRLVEPVKAAIRSGCPYLGICLGLQLLFDRSEEGEGSPGLSVFSGVVKRFNTASGLKVPHMGWNQVSTQQTAHSKQQTADSAKKRCPLLQGISDGSFFYFVHSYYADPTDKSVVALEADYGGPFTAMAWKDNVYATQFHPEKSQTIGLKLLENFIKL